MVVFVEAVTFEGDADLAEHLPDGALAGRLAGRGATLDREFPFLFTYLKCPGLEATNYRAEQAIRPAAVMRKVWGGNRTATGARTQGILLSVLRTSHQNNVDPLPLLADLLRSPHAYVLEVVPLRPAPN